MSEDGLIACEDLQPVSRFTLGPLPSLDASVSRALFIFLRKDLRHSHHHHQH